MPTWVRGFIIRDINEIHAAFRELLSLSEELARITQGRGASGRFQAGGRVDPAFASMARDRLLRVRALYDTFNREVRVTAQRGAAEATQGIRDRLDRMQLRPDTDSSPHLRDLIFSAPINIGNIPTGMVGIADVDRLNRAINRRTPGYGPYWRAQEYGTGFGEVPSQVGRIIYGYFDAAGGGDATPPQAQYAGGGGGPHPVFQPVRQQNFGLGGYINRQGFTTTGAGLGTIGAEIQPKGFIRYGADKAAVAWRARLAVIQQQVIDGLAALPV